MKQIISRTKDPPRASKEDDKARGQEERKGEQRDVKKKIQFMANGG